MKKSEPTFKQHKLLEEIKRNGDSVNTTETESLYMYWELVRGGYLKKTLSFPSGWRFDLTDEAERYLNGFNLFEKGRDYKEVKINDEIRGYVDRTFADDISVKLPCGYKQRFWIDGSDESKILVTEYMKSCGIKSA